MSRYTFKKQRMKEGRKKEGKEDLPTKLIFGIISSDLYSKEIMKVVFR